MIAPFQVFPLVIGRIPIDVVHVILFFLSWKLEGKCTETMQVVALLVNLNTYISLGTWFWSAHHTLCGPKTAERGYGSHLSHWFTGKRMVLSRI